ncbi:hypothetical protein CcI49_11545 [Frankia sp. CcI49]|nr:hypothetical protein CcI49_11545 [Frankia sp. CcI49]
MYQGFYQKMAPTAEQGLEIFEKMYGGSPADTMEITDEVVWEFKGFGAPGAADMTRRPTVMDLQGIRTQLIFPTMGLFAFMAALGGGLAGFPRATPEEQETALRAVDAYNEWAATYTRQFPNRLRIVGIIPSGRSGYTPELLLEETQRQIAMGMKAVLICTGLPTGGLSPAHPRMDPFYAALAEANVPLAIHAVAGVGYRAFDDWGRIPGELHDVSILGSHHHAEENFVATLVVGGVFERHPNLRLGLIETGSGWLGPLAERLDVWHPHLTRPIPYTLPRKPSDYINSNVRVSALAHEPVEKFFQRYPNIQDTFCYSSDYPHPEGLVRSLDNFYERLAPLGDEVVQKFFVDNPKFLCP